MRRRKKAKVMHPNYMLIIYKIGRFHRGKIYRYKDAAKDIKSLTAFALHKFKEQRGHRVPEPPTALEHFYEHVKERAADILVCFAILLNAFRINLSGYTLLTFISPRIL